MNQDCSELERPLEYPPEHLEEQSEHRTGLADRRPYPPADISGGESDLLLWLSGCTLRHLFSPRAL